jgi:uncharacterized protein
MTSPEILPEIQPGTGRVRLAGPDVTRAVALIGVVVMNYHGYLNGGGSNDTFAGRLFDPYFGPLSTRFAATFVTVAGVGIALLTNRSRLTRSRTAIMEDRWKLLRRGLLLYSFGLLIEWIWNGTILFYYGAFFIVGALIFAWRTWAIGCVGAVSALIGAGVQWWQFEHQLNFHDTSWLDPQINSPRNLLLRTFIGYTHPLFPWLAFLCVGIVLGRNLSRLAALRPRLILIGIALTAATYLIHHFGTPAGESTSASRWNLLLATTPFQRGLLYTIGTIGTSLVAFCVISWLADRFPTAALTRVFQHAGQMTLSLYLTHILVFNLFTHWLHWVRPTGLDTALVFSLVFWVCAIAAASAWHSTIGTGPLERIYRGFGG